MLATIPHPMLLGLVVVVLGVLFIEGFRAMRAARQPWPSLTSVRANSRVARSAEPGPAAGGTGEWEGTQTHRLPSRRKRRADRRQGGEARAR